MEKLQIQRLIRKNKDILYTAGYGLLIFVLWGLLKTILYVFGILPSMSEDQFSVESTSYLIYILTATIFSDILSFIVFYLCRREGRNDIKVGKILRILGGLLLIFSIGFVIGDIIMQIRIGQFDLIAILIIFGEAIYAFFTILVFASSIRLSYLYMLEERPINER